MGIFIKKRQGHHDEPIDKGFEINIPRWFKSLIYQEFLPCQLPKNISCHGA